MADLKNILLIEDDPHDVELTLTALEEHNLANKVVVVCDGAEALDFLYRRGKFKMRSGGNPIVVLLDNKMPKVSGLEVLRIMKADDHLRIIPIVALTSSREAPDLIEFYKHGVNAYVVKPIDFSEFTEVVKRLGIFWTFVNEPPPRMERRGTFTESGGVVSLANKEVINEVSTPHPAPGG